MGHDEIDSLTGDNEMSRTILFVPSNPSHVATQLPVAVELHNRGHRTIFLSRDSFIKKEYRVESLLTSKDLSIIRYPSNYESDFGRMFPKITSYLKFDAELSNSLSEVGADAVVVCNDDAALFDRMVVELFRRAGKHAFLIQESVRPAIRMIPFTSKFKELGSKEILYELVRDLAFRFRLGPFFRKGYAHSSGTIIFTAGDMFRNRLMEEGIEESRIIVTGQPRLDGNAVAPNTLKLDKNNAKAKVLLFCNQPVKCSMETQERLFLDLVEVTDGMDDVRLLVKLHPRDHPESYWMSLLGPGQGRSLLEVTRTRALASCFEMADAFMTIASTTCLEAMDFGLPVGLIDYLPIEWHLPYNHLEEAIIVKSVSELLSSVEMLLFDESLRSRLRKGAEQVLDKELYLRDGKSAWRIANQIEKAIT